MADLPTVLETRVRFDETDLQGVVYFGEYFTYADEAFMAFQRAVGVTYREMEAEGWTTHVAHADMDYRATATVEDVLSHGLRVAAIGESSFRVAYEARREADDELVADGELVYVAVDADTGETTRVPSSFRDAVAAFQADPPERE